MIDLGPNRLRIDYSNPKAAYRKRFAKSKTRCLPGRHVRSGNNTFYSAMSVPRAKKLEEGDGVSVIGMDGQRRLGIVQKTFHGKKKVWIQVSYNGDAGFPIVMKCESNKNGRKMNRLVYPTDRPSLDF